MENALPLEFLGITSILTEWPPRNFPAYKDACMEVTGLKTTVTSVLNIVAPPKEDLFRYLLVLLQDFFADMRRVTPDHFQEQARSTAERLFASLDKVDNPDSEFWMAGETEKYQHCLEYVYKCLDELERVLYGDRGSLLSGENRARLEEGADRLVNFQIRLLFKTDSEFAKNFSR
jgi:glutathionyl-hydroquinone reductase